GGAGTALTVAVLRVFLATLVAGGFLSVSFALSLSGALASALLITWGRRWGGARLTSRGLGVAGAAAHNLGQVVAFWLLSGQRGALLYLPPLLLLAVPAGACTGIAAALLQPFVLGRLERQEVVEAHGQTLSQEGDGR
ncbi:MAG: Gx transporter family protein, partial [Bacillota bacterium]|nr:Gx transporter family protein [Bacillota bacterium]